MNASRSVTFPAGSDTVESQADWHALIVAAIEAAQTDLSMHAGRVPVASG
ncbi:hypothetical protein L53_14535 [Hyphomonas sp. L-53-1-40]|nr:hypothetical protein [Hyphomonas sp. L-53-1-40]KCZ61567.1 hypothetical protein L53_14535 [Hyphomonas sp. L-53-1-40]